MVMYKKFKEHAGEVWHCNVIESGAHDNFSRVWTKAKERGEAPEN
jgi:hypothetical protein